VRPFGTVAARVGTGAPAVIGRHGTTVPNPAPANPRVRMTRPGRARHGDVRTVDVGGRR
jgi:hypothetical protein